MKQLYSISTILIFIISACSPSQKITATWVSPDLEKRTVGYNSIFLMANSNNDDVRFSVEKKLSKLLKDRNKPSVCCSDVFPSVEAQKGITKEQLMGIIKDKGCDAIFTITVLNTKEEEHYVAGTASYSPYGYNYGYYAYYNYYQPQVYTRGYYVAEKTYYLESNLYDVANDKLMWSIQSSACDPANFDAWFRDYSKMMLLTLHRRKLIIQ